MTDSNDMVGGSGCACCSWEDVAGRSLAIRAPRTLAALRARLWRAEAGGLSFTESTRVGNALGGNAVEYESRIAVPGRKGRSTLLRNRERMQSRRGSSSGAFSDHPFTGACNYKTCNAVRG